MKILGFITKVCAALLLVACLITACGGDGGYSGKKAQFVDSVVSGISYSTSSSKSGVTDAKGKFVYNTGDTITFSIGNIVFPGGIPQEGIITPAHLAGNAEWEEDETAINIIRFLLTIDEDGNPNNGIQIPAEAAEFALDEIDFSDTAAFDMAADVFFEDLVVEIDFTYDALVTDEVAIEHFSATIEELGIEIEIQFSTEAVACNSANMADIQGTWTGSLADTFGDPTYLGSQTIVVEAKNLTIGEILIDDSCTYEHAITTQPVERITDTWEWTVGADTYTLVTTDLEVDTTTFTVSENNGLDVSTGTISQE